MPNRRPVPYRLVPGVASGLVSNLASIRVPVPSGCGRLGRSVLCVQGPGGPGGYGKADQVLEGSSCEC
jgi:hypothetical protein